MYNTKPEVKTTNSDTKEVSLKGRGTNNVVLEFGNEKLDLSTLAYVENLQNELKKANTKIKNLESSISRLNYESNKLKTELNSIKQLLNR